MIELISGLPDEVVGIEAVGTVTSSDYAEVAVPAVESALARHGKIRLIHVLGERMKGHSPGAVWDDARLGVRHLRSFERIAVVTDSEPIRVAVKTGGWSVPGEMRLFSNAEREDAEAWASEGLHRPGREVRDE